MEIRIPIVAKWEVVKLFSQKRRRRQVFPTPESPIMRTFARKSYALAPFVVILVIWCLSDLDYLF